MGKLTYYLLDKLELYILPDYSQKKLQIFQINS